MKTWKLTLEYDGTRYGGWQEQINARSVAGELRKAIEESLKTRVDLQGSGRTDAGVHARAQVAHLRAETPRRPSLRAINDLLPADIVLLSLEDAAPNFHARHDASSRQYVYQISTRKSAFAKKHVWWIKEDLDLSKMEQAAERLPGRHDFRHFRAENPSKPGESTTVEVNSASLKRRDDLILFRIEASHFLWRMVRRIVGALVKVGLGELSVVDFALLLQGKPIQKFEIAAWTAPASGLFLEKVNYPLRARPTPKRRV